MNKQLKKFNLNPNNSVVIGSGILQALGIRKSKDIDMVVKQDIYDKLKKSGQFSIFENQGKEILDDGLFEIGVNWMVLGKAYTYNDLLKFSEIIDGVRYNSLNFLLKVKESWVDGKTSRPKDIKDIKLIKKYLKKL